MGAAVTEPKDDVAGSTGQGPETWGSCNKCLRRKAEMPLNGKTPTHEAAATRLRIKAAMRLGHSHGAQGLLSESLCVVRMRQLRILKRQIAKNASYGHSPPPFRAIWGGGEGGWDHLSELTTLYRIAYIPA